jgi:hypothetical protein
MRISAADRMRQSCRIDGVRVSESYWEQTVYAVSSLVALERIDDSDGFTWLSRRFEPIGAKIAWSQINGRHEHQSFVDPVDLTAAAVREIGRRAHGETAIEHLGDGASPYGVRFVGSAASTVVAPLLEIPEHHYFLAADQSWVIVASSEGDLDVWDGDEPA